MLNSIGLANPGIDALPRRRPAAARARSACPSGSRSAASRAHEYARRCARLDGRDEVAAIELNLSCPNVDEAPESAAEIVAACRAATAQAALREALAGRLGRRRGRRARSRRRGRRRALAREHDPRPRARRADAAAASRHRASAATPGPALQPIALAAVYACRARDGAADRRHGRRADRARRARADRRRRDRGRARHRALRRPGRAGARACGARRRGDALGFATSASAMRARARAASPMLAERARKSLQFAKTLRFDRAAERLLDSRAHGHARRPRPRLQLRSLDQRMEALEAGERDPGPAGAAEEGPEGRARPDRVDPARAARVRRDREGVRHAHGRAEVRPRQGGAASSTSAGSASRRPSAGCPSGSARSCVGLFDRCRTEPGSERLPDRPVFVITGPSGAGKGTLIRRLARARARARARGLGDDAAAPPGEERRRDYWFLSEEEFVELGRRRRVPRVRRLRVGPPVRDAAARSSTGSPARARRRVLELEIEGALHVKDDVPGSVTIFIDAPTRRARAPAPRAGDREHGRDRASGIELARRQHRARGASSTTWS